MSKNICMDCGAEWPKNGTFCNRCGGRNCSEKNNSDDRKDFFGKVLSEFIYKLHKKRSFYLDESFFTFAVPYAGFAYDNSLGEGYLDKLKKENWINLDGEKVIARFSDFDIDVDGIIFTDKALYVQTSRNKDQFKVSYSNIKELEYCSSTANTKPHLVIHTHSDKRYAITNKLWSKLNIKIFLQAVQGFSGFSEKEKERINDIELKTLNNNNVGAVIAGTIYGNASSANSMWMMNKFSTMQGHGFAAERMNHLYDYLYGHDVKIVGDDNAKNGADRVVDGINYQSKYCMTGEACINACFDKSGNFRYLNSDGSVMKIEVPSDKYDEAVKALKEKIQEGKVPGCKDPAEANDIVKKGHFTYEQAKNVAKAGTIDSLKYDAASSAVVCSSAAGITAVIIFAQEIWDGETFDVALRNAAIAGIKVGGMAWITGILGMQIARTGVMAVSQQIAAKFVNLIGTEAAQVLVSALRAGGKNIYGAAATKHLTKVLKSNLVTAGISVIILSAEDVYDVSAGRISGRHFVKNVVVTTSGIAAGYAGWAVGAKYGSAIGMKIGTAICPGTGTTMGATIGAGIGAFLGAVAFNSAAGNASKELLDLGLDNDDVKEVCGIIKYEFKKLVDANMLFQYEIENVLENFKGEITPSMIKEIYEKKNINERKDFVDELIIKYINIELKYRCKIKVDDMAIEKATVDVLKYLQNEKI